MRITEWRPTPALEAETTPSGKALAIIDEPCRNAFARYAAFLRAVVPGCCYWGLYVDSLNHLFLRNDPLLRDEAGALVSVSRRSKHEWRRS